MDQDSTEIYGPGFSKTLWTRIQQNFMDQDSAQHIHGPTPPGLPQSPNLNISDLLWNILEVYNPQQLKALLVE